jgi:prepilin-type N-terminal cleavage/methylation domain-containing protein
MQNKPNSGFVLIELVTTLILIGVIGAFAGLFLYNGINGYMASKRNSEAALRGQVVLDRLSAELRYISSLPANPVANTSITYKTSDSKLPGTRKIRYDPGSKTIYFSIDSGTEIPLLDQVDSFSLSWPSTDMDNADGDEDPSTGSQEISSILIEFTLPGIGTKFTVRTHPRVFIAKP